MDNSNPLPQAKLDKRYKGFLEDLSNGVSGSLIGTYKSPKSGYLKHILETEALKNKYISKDRKVIYFEPTSLTVENPYYWLFQLAVAIEIQDPEYISPSTDDVAAVLASIQKYIIQNKRVGKGTSFIINKLDSLENLKENSLEPLLSLYKTLRATPDNACSLHFLLNNLDPFTDTLLDNLKPLQYPIRDSVHYFAEHDQQEASYVLKRLAKIWKVKTTDRGIEECIKLSGGIYSILFDCVQIASQQKKTLDKDFVRVVISEHPVVTEFIGKYLASFPHSKRRDLVNIANSEKIEHMEFYSNLGIVDSNGKIRSSALDKYLKHLNLSNVTDPAMGVFTESERRVYNLLEERFDQLVSREELANFIWSEDDETRFSSWALDKFISRLRKKISIKDPTQRLSVIRKKGVILCR